MTLGRQPSVFQVELIVSPGSSGTTVLTPVVLKKMAYIRFLVNWVLRTFVGNHSLPHTIHNFVAPFVGHNGKSMLIPCYYLSNISGFTMVKLFQHFHEPIHSGIFLLWM